MPLKDDGDTPQEKLPRSILITLRGILLGCIANAVSLSGPGAIPLLKQRVWQQFTRPFVLSFMPVGKKREQRMSECLGLRNLLERYMSDSRSQFALQINFGCPNAELCLESLRNEIVDMLQIFATLNIPLICNFSAPVPAELLLKLQRTGLCHAFWLGNTIPYDFNGLGQKVFGHKESPLLARNLPIKSAGGISGLVCLRYTLSTIRQARALGVTIPIIAGNGIQSPLGVWRAWRAGADAIAIGTIALIRPFMMMPTIITAHLLFKSAT